MTKSWGDMNDDEEKTPHFTTMGPDGIKTITEFRTDDEGNKIKIVRKVKETKEVTRVHKAVVERRKWKKFGKAADAPPGPEPNVTYRSHEFINLQLRPRKEREEADNLNEEQRKKLAGKSSIVVCSYCKERGHFSLKCPKRGNIETKAVKAEVDPRSTRRADGSAATSSSDSSGRYVPPHRGSGGHTDRNREDEYSIRVTNISEDTTEDDLRYLFRRFGHTSRIYLAKDHTTQVSRGFAFISYISKEAAQAAIDTLDGHGYDNLILHVEFAKPREDRNEERKNPNWTMRGTK